MAKSQVEGRLDRHDKQIGAIRDLLHQGMRLVVETRKDLRTLGTKVDRLVDTVQALSEDVRRVVPNGHKKRKIELS